MSAWLPITRASMICVMSVSLSARRASCWLSLFNLANQLALRITQRAGDIRVLGDGYEGRKAGQSRTQFPYTTCGRSLATKPRSTWITLSRITFRCRFADLPIMVLRLASPTWKTQLIPTLISYDRSRGRTSGYNSSKRSQWAKVNIVGAQRGSALVACELRAQRVKEFRQWHRRNTDCGVADAVRQHQSVGVHQRTTRIDDIGYVAVLLVRCGTQQWVPQPTDNPCRILEVEKDRPDAVSAHRANAVGENQPTSVGFNRRTTVSQL